MEIKYKIFFMKRKTKEQFIEEARKVHGDRYDYSKVEYVNNSTKVCIICSQHGEFWQTPKIHLKGFGCSKCTNKHNYTTEEWVNKTKQVHGDKYDYSKVTYNSSHEKVCIICPIHGEFWQMPYLHINGRNGCPECNQFKKSNTDEFVEKVKKIHGNKYDYSKVKYINAYTKVRIICPNHGEFFQTPHMHLLGQGCPKCRSSKLENMVKVSLEKNKIDYIFQYRNKNVLGNQTFDFYIPTKKIGIECQGGQHFYLADFGKHDLEYSKKEFKVIQQRDEQKIRKCKENGIKLIHYNPFEKYFGTYENEVHNMEELEKLLLTSQF